MTSGASRSAEGGVTPLTVAFDSTECLALALTGGKGASLSELVHEGLPVPAGFVVTTAAFASFMNSLTGAAEHLERLDALAATDTGGIRQAARAFRAFVQSAAVPEDIAQSILKAHLAHCGDALVAVRSSATLEDLDSASFAGQHDTYLSVEADRLVDRVRACWVSLFADNAVAYRRRNQLHERDAQMAVVVQTMARADCAGVLFTVNPLTGRRDHCAIDANWGLGESVVSGQVNPDHYIVDSEARVVLSANIGNKELAIVPTAAGGVETIMLDEQKKSQRVLTDGDLLTLVDLGKKLERLKEAPQDIEWCLEDGRAVLLQSRPITSLFPKPRPERGDGHLRAYMCVGHQQANPAAFSPFMCGLMRWVPPFGRDEFGRSSLVTEAGHRGYVDITGALLTFPMRRILPTVLDDISPAIAQRARAVRDRADFQRARGRIRFRPLAFVRMLAPALPRALARMFWHQPEQAKHDWSAFISRYSGEVEQRLARVQETAQGDRDAAVVREVTRIMGAFFEDVLPPMAIPILLPGVLSVKLLSKLLAGKVDSGVIDQLMRGLAGNIVTEMDLMIGDVADLLQADEERLKEAWAASNDEEARNFIERQASTRFGTAWKDLVQAYGHRAPGELDMAVPRWSQAPHTLLQVVLGKTQVEPGAHRRRHEQGVEASRAAEETLVQAAERGLFGGLRRRLVRFLVRRARAYYAMREHHKYILIVAIDRLRKAMLDVGRRGVEAGWLKSAEDVFFLRPEEFFDNGGHRSAKTIATIEARRANHARFAAMYPPPLLLSTGEVPVAAAAEVDAPEGALVGAPVSAGVVTGTARVLRHPNDDVLAPGEILVASFTDAAWTTLFVHAGAVVLEAGGVMSHGSVIAREYGIPAVAGVPEATRRIESGQQIRVDGDRGIVEVLERSRDDA